MVSAPIIGHFAEGLPKSYKNAIVVLYTVNALIFVVSLFGPKEKTLIIRDAQPAGGADGCGAVGSCFKRVDRRDGASG